MKPESKAPNNDDHGQSGGSKTGMGIDGPMNAHALLIGVGRCEYSAWSLPVASLDARELRKILVDPDLCAYPEAQIQIVTDEDASRDGILAALENLARVTTEDPDATVLVYYSGHGWRQMEDGRERYFLIPHDVRPHELESSALPAEDFIRGLKNLKSRRVLVMMDTCHASGMADAKKPTVASMPRGFAQEPFPGSIVSEFCSKGLVEDLTEGEGRAVFLSCDKQQKSWIIPGEGSLSIFTHHLLDALQGAGCAPEDRFVTVSSLMNHLSRTVSESAQKIGREQTPVFKFETQNLPVALIRGGKGLGAVSEPATTGAKEPGSIDNSITTGAIDADRDVFVVQEIGTLTTGSSGA